MVGHEDNLPKVIRVVTSIAIGIASEMIHAEFKKRNLIITLNDSPLPKKRSRFFKINCDNKTKISIKKVVKNGAVNSFRRYLFNTFTRTIYCSNI